MKKSLSLMPAIVITLLVLTFQSCNHPDPAPQVQLPAIESFTPDAAPVGTTVTITGTFFSADASKDVVSFNGTQATVSNATETQLTVTVPANATTGKLTVAVNGNTATSANNFTVTTTPVNQQPTLTGFSPASGLVGIEVIITGTNFSTTPASNVVKFNGAAATVTQATATQLKATVPAGATTGKVSVIVNGVTLTSTTDFTVTPGQVLPTIAGFLPTSGAVGIDVTITGTNFSATATSNVVTFNNVAANVKQAAADGTSLTVTVPATATTGKIAVTVNGVKVSSGNDFTVTVAGGNGWRVKETYKDSFKTTEYVYDDNNNKLIHTKNFDQDHTDPNSVAQQYSTTDFFYNADGTLSSTKEGDFPTNANNAYDVFDYQYASGILQSYTYSDLFGAVKTLKFTNTYTYQNGVMVSSSHDDVQYGASGQTYTYTTDANGNPQRIAHYTNFDNTITLYLNVYSPDPLDIVTPTPAVDKLITKTVISGYNANFNENVTYTINADGNIGSVHYDVPATPVASFTFTYVYETY